MAELLDPTEIFWSAFEPKTSNRFIMYIEGIPAFLIKAVSLPKIKFGDIVLDHINGKRKLAGKGDWEPINIKMYDPVVPSGRQAVIEWIRLCFESATLRSGYSDFYKKDITLNSLGPVGDKVSELTLKGAFVSACDLGEHDWANDQPVEINCTITYDYCLIQY